MPDFSKEFIASKGQPIIYNGETLYMGDFVPVPEKFRLSVHLVSTHSEWPQIIRFRVNRGGYLLCNNKKGTMVSLHANGMPPIVEVSGYSKDKKLLVYNAWIRDDWMGNEVVDSWVHGAAMKKVVCGDTIRYYCNDGHFDDNFDDLVFEITVLNEDGAPVFPEQK